MPSNLDLDEVNTKKYIKELDKLIDRNNEKRINILFNNLLNHNQERIISELKIILESRKQNVELSDEIDKINKISDMVINLYHIVKHLGNHRDILLCSNAKTKISDALEILIHFYSSDYEKVDQIANILIDIDPKNGTALYFKGKILYQNKDFDEALKYFNKAIQSKTINNDIYYYKSKILYLQGNIEEAEKSFSKITEESKSRFAHIPNLYGLILQKQGKNLDAIEEFKKAHNQNSTYPDPLHNIGISYKNLQQYDKALEYFEKAIVVDKNYFESYHSIGNIYFEQRNDLIKAIEFYHKTLGINPKHQNSIRILGYAYYKLEKFKEAKEFLERAITDSTEYKRTQYYLGNIYIESSEQSEVSLGITYLKQLARRGYADAQYELGVRYLYGDKIEADYTKAKKLLSYAAEKNHEYAKRVLNLIDEHETIEKQKINESKTKNISIDKENPEAIVAEK